MGYMYNPTGRRCDRCCCKKIGPVIAGDGWHDLDTAGSGHAQYHTYLLCPECWSAFNRFMCGALVQVA